MKPVPGTPYMIPDCEEHFLEEKRGRRYFDEYQWDRVDLALKHVTDLTVAVDAGANCGIVSRKLAMHFGRVLAFEPAPDTFEALEYNSRQQITNIEVFQGALGETCGFVGIDKSPTKNTGSRQVDPEGSDIPMWTLDSFELETCGLIKLDVQGYELAVLKGGIQTLQRCRPVLIVEVEDTAKLPRVFVNPQKAIGFLLKHGYKEVGRIGHDYILACPK
jgi:FkbM family methyltransferase